MDPAALFPSTGQEEEQAQEAAAPNPTKARHHRGQQHRPAGAACPIAPPPQPLEAAEGARDSQDSQQQTSACNTAMPTARTRVIRGLTPLEARAARAIPLTSTTEMSALDELHPQPDHHATTETKCNNSVYRVSIVIVVFNIKDPKR